MSKILRAVIVDDERLARRELAAMLRAHPGVELAGEAEGVLQAAALIDAERPDAVFLDVQMPGESGFDLLERIDRKVRIVFVTAFDRYAIRAFDANALDYLLKPVHPDRLRVAVERLLGARQADAAPIEHRPLTYEDLLFLELGERSRFVKVRAILRIVAAADQSEVLTADGQVLRVAKSLREWESRLPESHFARVHRSAIVNLDHVERVEPWFHHAYRLFLRSIAEPLIVSRRYAARLRRDFG